MTDTPPPSGPPPEQPPPTTPPGWAAPQPPTPPPPAPPYQGAQPQPQPQPQAGWGAPPPYGYYPGYQAPTTDGTAVVSLVLAIASFVICPVVPAIVALVLASQADRTIMASGGYRTGLGLTKAARIVAWINIGLTVASIVFFVAIVIFAAIFSSDDSTVRALAGAKG